MSVPSELLAAYRWNRQQAYTASKALHYARNDVAAGIKRYPPSPLAARLGMPFEGYHTKGLRWCEKPADVGLRFVGYADKIDSAIRHEGWFTDNDQSDKVRGVVYQLPGRGKAPRFVSGYDNADNGAADCGGPAAIDFSTVWEGTPPALVPAEKGWSAYWSWDSDPTNDPECRTAARHADRLAERMAENEREYQAAWQAGSRFAALGEDIASERKTALALLAEFRTARRELVASGYVVLCAAIREKVTAIRESIAEARDERAKLAEGDYVAEWLPGWNARDADMVAAFNEGAGI